MFTADRGRCSSSNNGNIEASISRSLDERLRDVPSPPSGIAQVGTSGGQLTSLRARSATEFRVVFVRAVSRLHDQVALREERVVLAVRVDEYSWNGGKLILFDT